VNEDWVADDRRKLLAFARDLLNSDYAGHRLTFQLFAQAPPFAHLAAVYRNFDWDGPLDFVKKAANLSDRVMEPSTRVSGDGAVTQWYGANPPAAALQSPPASHGQAAAPSPAASAAPASVVRLAGANSRVA